MLPNKKQPQKRREKKMEKKELKELRKETIKKLEEIKNNLSYDMEKNYCDMVNAMIDYDNEAQDDLYLHDTCQERNDFVDDETLEYYVDYQIKTFGKDRYFYMFNQVNNVCGIYRIDGYGNLANVDNDTLKDCIDEAIEQLNDAIKESEDQ